MNASAHVVFLIDVDNTLLDHDALKLRVTDWISRHPKAAPPSQFWSIYEQVRQELGIVDFLEAATRFGEASGSRAVGEELHGYLWDHDFAEIAFAGVLETLLELRRLGPLVVLCDGHEPFQRRKLEVLGIAPQLDGVFVFDHKESHLDEVTGRFPAERYLMLDDKPRIHHAVKRELGERVTTVLVRQGHYAAADFESERASIDFEVESFAAVPSLPFVATLATQHI